LLPMCIACGANSGTVRILFFFIKAIHDDQSLVRLLVLLEHRKYQLPKFPQQDVGKE
jgi:hypothetical protein